MENNFFKLILIFKMALSCIPVNGQTDSSFVLPSFDSVVVFVCAPKVESVRVIPLEEVKRRAVYIGILPSNAYPILRQISKIPIDSSLSHGLGEVNSTISIELYSETLRVGIIGVSEFREYCFEGRRYKKNKEINEALKSILPRWKWKSLN